MPKVSVVVPCLNMEKYISECVRSIMQQTLEDLEVIIVDAGSIDRTLPILRELGQEDKRIHIIHSEKKSYGYQVNLGIQMSSGQYIAIVDADDRIAQNMYEILFEHAILSDADYVKGAARSFYTLTSDKAYYIPITQLSVEEYVERRSILVPKDRPDLLTRDNFLWYGIYKKTFVKAIRLHESPGAAFQDLGGLLQTQMNARSAVYLNQPFYEYRQDNMGASGYNQRGFEFVWNEYKWAEKFIIGAPHIWKAAFYRKLFLHTLDRYYAMSASGIFWDDAEIYIKLIREKIEKAMDKKGWSEQDFSARERGDLQLFLVDDYGLYDKYESLFMNKKRQIANILEAVNNREIVIFGCGKYGKFLHALVLKHGSGKVVGYCDNAAGLQQNKIWGLAVFRPDDAVRKYPDACFVVANRYHSEEMKQQLIKLGVPELRISFYTAGIDMRLFGAKL